MDTHFAAANFTEATFWVVGFEVWGMAAADINLELPPLDKGMGSKVPGRTR